MKNVYRLKVTFRNINKDLFFEDKKTAEAAAKFLTEMAGNNSSELIIEPLIEPILTPKDFAEQVIKGILFGIYLPPN
ncbi:MAG: hypothetical protein AB7S72_15165 [Draconibacterium sp.]